MSNSVVRARANESAPGSGDRHFILNRYSGKAGRLQVAVIEAPSRAEAESIAALARRVVRHLTDREAESFEVWSGPKTGLNRRLRQEGARVRYNQGLL